MWVRAKVFGFLSFNVCFFFFLLIAASLALDSSNGEVQIMYAPLRSAGEGRAISPQQACSVQVTFIGGKAVSYTHLTLPTRR